MPILRHLVQWAVPLNALDLHPNFPEHSGQQTGPRQGIQAKNKSNLGPSQENRSLPVWDSEENALFIKLRRTKQSTVVILSPCSLILYSTPSNPLCRILSISSRLVPPVPELHVISFSKPYTNHNDTFNHPLHDSRLPLFILILILPRLRPPCVYPSQARQPPWPSLQSPCRSPGCVHCARGPSRHASPLARVTA